MKVANLEVKMVGGILSTNRIWELPPLILHPSSEPQALATLALGARAGLVLQGATDSDGLEDEDWKRHLLDCRYCEIRMLYFLGKDLSRWVDQCADLARRDVALSKAGVQRGSFVDLLVNDTPHTIVDKMRGWGVGDCGLVFRHALGLGVLFEVVPRRELLTEEFLCHHRRYATALFDASHGRDRFTVIRRPDIHVKLYASAEYAKLLEAQWALGE
jgi:hypothetical protein